jgi:hypothetical protein
VSGGVAQSDRAAQGIRQEMARAARVRPRQVLVPFEYVGRLLTDAGYVAHVARGRRRGLTMLVTLKKWAEINPLLDAFGEARQCNHGSRVRCIDTKLPFDIGGLLAFDEPKGVLLRPPFADHIGCLSWQ